MIDSEGLKVHDERVLAACPPVAPIPRFEAILDG